MSKHRKGQARAYQKQAQPQQEFAFGEQSQVDTRIPILEGKFTPQTDMVDYEPDPRLTPYEVDERQLQLLVRDWRRGRATRTFWNVLSDGYIAVITVAMVGAMLVNLILEAQKLSEGQADVGSAAARVLLPWAALFGALAATVAVARMFGPVVASAAEGFWILEAPLRRGRMLAGRLRTIIVVVGIIGAVVGALVAALTGAEWLAVAAWATGTGLASAAIMAFAAARQGAEHSVDVRIAQAIVSLAGVATLLVVVATAAGWIDVSIGTDRGDRFALMVGGLGLIIAILAGWVARRRLSDLRRIDLVSGGALAAGLQGAAFALDFALMRDILTERRAMRKGRVQPTRGRGLGPSTLVWRDVQRIFRDPAPLLLLAVSIVVPYAVQALGLGPLVAPLSAMVLMGALIPFLGALRVLTRTKGLARSMPFSTAQIRQATSTVPTLLALVWGLAVALAFIGLTPNSSSQVISGLVVAGLTAVAGLLGAIRWITARPPDYSGPMMITQAGAMPPGMMMNMVRGFDIIALITLPLVFKLSPWVSVVIALIAWLVLRSGGMDREALLEQAAEQRAQAEALRNPKPKEKIKISRPTKR